MKYITFSNPIIADFINDNFYAINFNASHQDTIIINNKPFISQGKSQPHQLATALMNNNYLFPSVIFMDENFGVINVVNGFMLPKQIEIIINYFADDSYKSIKFNEYYKNFESKIK